MVRVAGYVIRITAPAHCMDQIYDEKYKRALVDDPLVDRCVGDPKQQI
jgi:hypothetical protein